MKDAIVYQDYTAACGVAVQIRARTYDEWEKQEDERIGKLEALNAEGTTAIGVEAALQRANLAVRNARLASWVRDFDTVKLVLSLRDIAEIEKACLALEGVEIPLGNSDAGGSGQ